MTRHRKQHRPGRSKKKEPDNKTAETFVKHPKFGKVPLVDQFWMTPEGKEIKYQHYDPDYQPKIPNGAVRGNARNQNYGLDCPRYYFEDMNRFCIQCRKEFIFTALEQKYWYESLKFHFDSIAVRCVNCRKQRRAARVFRQQIAEVSDALREEPDNPSHLIEYGDALLQLYERTGAGDLNKAVGAARKSRRLLRNIPQVRLYLKALYLEGRCQVQLERPQKATDCLQEFLAKVSKYKKGFKKEIQWTKAWEKSNLSTEP